MARDRDICMHALHALTESDKIFRVTLKVALPMEILFLKVINL